MKLEQMELEQMELEQTPESSVAEHKGGTPLVGQELEQTPEFACGGESFLAELQRHL